MVAFLIIVILIYVLVIVLVLVINSLFIVRLILVPKSAHLMFSWFPLFTKTVLGLAHLVVLSASEHSVVIVSLVIENLLLL